MIRGGRGFAEVEMTLPLSRLFTELSIPPSTPELMEDLLLKYWICTLIF
jgi:hypothetical protein